LPRLGCRNLRKRDRGLSPHGRILHGSGAPRRGLCPVPGLCLSRPVALDGQSGRVRLLRRSLHLHRRPAVRGRERAGATTGAAPDKSAPALIKLPGTPLMILIGQYDSPFVRRVGIALTLYGLPFEHRPWSTFSDAEKIRPYNPLTRVPTLVLDDGAVL